MSFFNILTHLVTTFFFVVYWTQVGSWYDDGVDWYGIIGSGVAANGAFFGNITHSIMEANAAYQSTHGGEDMPLVKNLSKLLFWKK